MAQDFLSQTLIPGIGGVDLLHSLDQIPATHLARMTNCIRTTEGEITGRPGLTQLFTTASDFPVHTIRRLNDRIGSTFEYVVGAGTKLYCGQSGALTLIDSGYSGSPLVTVPYHPPVSGDTWLIIADSSKMSKVRASDCAVASLGLAAVAASDRGFRIDEFAATADGAITGLDRSRFPFFGFTIGAGGPGAAGNLTTYVTQQTTTIDTCEAAGWTNNNGSGGAPTNATDAVNFKQGTKSVQFTGNPGAGAYYNFWNKANALNLSAVGTRVASDDDIIHLWLRADRPDIITEIRLYFVVSSIFVTTVLPGTSTADNKEAYVKTFRPSDFTNIIEASSTTIPTSATANANLSTLQQLSRIDDDRGGSVAILISSSERVRSQSLELSLGRGAWTEYGVIGLPLRRGDFRRIGSDTARDWSGVTGLVVSVHVSTNTVINVWIDDIYLTGGYGLDTSAVGMQPYNYRAINRDPRTGAKSNPSPPQTAAFTLDSLRRGIIVTPEAAGDVNIRQFIYRRGGTLNNAWYPVGENGSDGGSFTDTLSDLEILGQAQTFGTLEFDNDQPVTTVDAFGNEILAQPLPAIWDTGAQIIMGCGDPYRKGHIYWSKPEAIDHWPAANNVEACSPSEELMNGIAVSGASLVLSRERMFIAIPNMTNAGIVTVNPTACLHGLVARRGLCVTPAGVAFVSKDGIYLTGGGAEQNITDDRIRPLFHGETRNGYAPVDFTQPNYIRLACHDNELWFQYRDTNGNNQIAIFSLIFRYWRFYDFTPDPGEVYSDEATGSSRLLIGGVSAGIGYIHSGLTDAGTAIASSFRTGALNQSLPRVDKQYGDIYIDASGIVQLSINSYLNAEINALPLQLLTPGATRDRSYLNGPGDIYGRNISIDVAWTSSEVSPVIYELGVSYIPQPDTFTARVTDWDSQGRLNDKYVKGVLIEFDTGGVNKLLRVQADGVTQTTLTVNASGRQVRQYAFPQFRGRILRLNPNDVVAAKIYNFRWIFDDEPLGLTRFETQERDHGITGDHSLLWANISISSTAQVTLTITTYRQDGTSVANVYTLASTGGVKQKLFVPFNANKGVLHKYLFVSEISFWLYREESNVMVIPWGGNVREAHPFGNDDIDLVRQMQDAAMTSQR